MKIGVLSDTHFDDLNEGLHFLNSLCEGPFHDVDLLIHAGDIVHPDLLFCFDSKPILAVRGNCDESAPDLPEKRVEEIAGYRIGIVHGWGSPGTIVNNVLSGFDTESLDILVFGHSHEPLCQPHDDLLLFNPGSATDRRLAEFHSVGLLHLADNVFGDIINLDRPGILSGYFTGKTI